MRIVLKGCEWDSDKGEGVQKSQMFADVTCEWSLVAGLCGEGQPQARHHVQEELVPLLARRQPLHRLAEGGVGWGNC